LVVAALTGLGAFVWTNFNGFSPSKEDGSPVRSGDWESLANASALMFVAFAGYGRLATLGEEVTEPARNIPRAILITLAVTAVVYVLVAASVAGSLAFHIGGVNSFSKAEAGAPLAKIAARRFGSDSLTPAFVTAGAIAALGGSLLNLLLGLSRVLLAMARRGEMPAWLAAVRDDSPRRAVWAVGIALAAVAACGSVKLAWSVSACAVLLYYGLTNAAALRLPPESRRFPRAFAWGGLIGCASLAWFVTPLAAAITGGWLLAGGVWRGMMRRRGKKKGVRTRKPYVQSNIAPDTEG
ncbi:MAG: APC family permease, partial [Planctomycetota bacterium]